MSNSANYYDAASWEHARDLPNNVSYISDNERMFLRIAICVMITFANPYIALLLFFIFVVY